VDLPVVIRLSKNSLDAQLATLKITIFYKETNLSSDKHRGDEPFQRAIASTKR